MNVPNERRQIMTINDIIERYPLDILEHAERVMDLVRPFGKDYMTVALLHDIIEDTNTTLEELIKVIPVEIADDILVLTRFNNETYFEYISRITRCGKRATIVKYYDILDHLHERATLKQTLEKRYLKAKEILEKYISSIDI